MIFSALKEFKKEVYKSIDDIAAYFSVELNATLRELRTGLYRLSFDDNFQSFVKVLEFEAGEEKGIKNELDTIPRFYIKVRSDQNGLLVCDGDTQWTQQLLYLKNTSAGTARITVIFFK